jgi:16S rRNA (guanine966-N2)-methyltransferase
VRVISGKFKSRRFSVPKGFPSRPTTDFAKEGLFNLLENRLDLDGVEVLDLFAGTGNIGLEFLSRGAQKVTAVDQNFKCVRHIFALSKQLDIASNLDVVKSECLQFVSSTKGTFDIVFADPPYDYKGHHTLYEEILKNHLAKNDGLVIIEHGRQTSFDKVEGFMFLKTYGNVYFSFLKPTAE